ncbi:MAG: type I-E CRISPR-associated protein Cse2/CasB [Acidobacteriota bacterium]|nr:type I-E CRISPR-associated protein Cse2/CasB [Blastocatellia bacterium]MDW8240442.1 type I-E CRISPR-associated protein Cse2/CasB [Acidobacteriota bacterium]
MNTKQTDPQELAAQFLKYLRQLKNDRGAMADLRRALNPAQRHRAWPLLARFGGIGNARYETVAGLFAHHPEETNAGNLGTTCRQLGAEHNTFEGRFRRLLACDREEICDHIRPVVFVAKSKGVPVNYEQLFVDLWYWSDAVKVRWAAEFWGAPASEETGAPAITEAVP